jgi:hypothetical protein
MRWKEVVLTADVVRALYGVYPLRFVVVHDQPPAGREGSSFGSGIGPRRLGLRRFGRETCAWFFGVVLSSMMKFGLMGEWARQGGKGDMYGRTWRLFGFPPLRIGFCSLMLCWRWWKRSARTR